MPQSISRALVAALLGACAGVVAAVAWYWARPGLVVEFDRDLPGYTAGFYPTEHAGDTSFAWTSENAGLRLWGLDRERPWSCVVRLKGQRPPGAPPAVATITGDGVILTSVTAPADYEDVPVTLPARPASRGATVLAIATSPTFVPGPSDSRALGVQVDRLACQPQERLLRPPRSVLTATAAAGAAFGAAFALIGLSLGAAACGVLVLAALQALPILAGLAPYGPFPARVTSLAIWIAALTVAGVKAVELARREPLHVLARAAIAASGTLLFLELLAILNPMKTLVDATFHAHRLQWVLAGRYFFVQPMPDGVSFPYAIGLYAFAAPWAALIADHVSLLRLVVCGWNAAAGLLLYAMIASAWGDRRVALLATVLFHVVPLPFITLGNANLTFVFGAAVMAVTVAIATGWPPGRRSVLAFVAIAGVASLALLSHVGIVGLLMAQLGAMFVLYLWRGGDALRVRAWSLAAAGVFAATFAFAIYYGHFGEVYQKLDRVVGRAAPNSEAPAETPVPRAESAPSSRVPATQRIVRTGELASRAYGPPLLLLVCFGAAQVIASRGRDRLTLTLAAFAATVAIFVFGTALAPVEARFVRYADEFIDRTYYVAAPAAAVLAARGALWMWSRNPLLRVIAGIALLGAGWSGVQAWLNWLR